MAGIVTWDQPPGVQWDAPGLTWDAVAAPPGPATPTNKKMAQVKLSLDRLSREQRVALAQSVHDAMDGNPDFPTPNPTLAALLAAIDAANTGIGQLTALRNQAEEKTVEVDGLMEILDGLLTGMSSYVQNTSGGDEAKIRSTGMDVRDAAAPVTVTQVLNLAASPGDDSGEVDLSWDPMPGAKSYEIQTSPDPITAGSWTHGGVSTRSSRSLSGLPIGSQCWFRVRAIGSRNEGAWSDPATKIVP